MELLKSEQAAKDFVEKIGISRSARLLNLIGDRILRRQSKPASIGQFVCDHVRIAPWERELMFNLKMGLSLLNDENTPDAAHRRILERIAQRRARHSARTPQLQ